MKARFIPNWGIELVAENDDEKYLLDCFDAQGIRVQSANLGRTSLTICSPGIAGLKQIHLNREQQTLLAYALALATLDLKGTGSDLENLKLGILGALVAPTRSVTPPPPKGSD